jgi:hypothetical protein
MQKGRWQTIRIISRSSFRDVSMMLLIALPFLAAPQQIATVEGVWADVSGGNVYQIQGATLRQFELTSRTCVLGFVAQRLPASVPNAGISFGVPGTANFSIHLGNDAGHLVLASPVGQVLTRLQQLPPLCTPPTPDTPFGNFEVFMQTFAERYAGLESRPVDWSVMVSSARSKLTGMTTPSELFDILEGLLAPLYDLHTFLKAANLNRSSREFWRAGPQKIMASGSRSLDGQGIARLFRPTERAFPTMVLRSFCRGQLLYGHVDDAIGYLRILSFHDYSTTEENHRALNRALDEILSDQNLMGLVIDIRVNLGGDDRLGLAAASHLTLQPYPAYRVERRVPGNKWEGSEIASVMPSGAPRYSGPVAELIGPLTMSAGEIFALALMGRTPHVTTIGEATQGLLGGVLGRHLPNGWVFGLPNTRTIAPDGRSFEAKGLVPEIHMPAYGDADSSQESDSPLAAALDVLRRQIRREQSRPGGKVQ